MPKSPPTQNIVIDGDKVQFLPTFPPAVVVVKPGEIKAKGKATFGTSKKLCILGDEKSVEVKGCNYISPPFVVPGKGTLKIFPFTSADINVAKKTKSNKKPVLLKGALFKAIFEVDAKSKAKTPPAPPAPPQMDPTPKYLGQASFITKNNKFTGR